MDSQGVVDNLAEIYSLIISIDHVERAYIRDTLGPSDYNEIMARFLSQYNKYVQDPITASAFTNLDTFVSRYRMEASTGVQRIRIGIPATSEAIDLPAPERSNSPSKKVGVSEKGQSRKAVAQAAGHFITFCDGIQLGYSTKNDLHPLLAELAASLNRVTKENFDGRHKIVEWLIKINKLNVDEKLSEEEAQECLGDVQKGYHSFLALLD